MRTRLVCLSLLLATCVLGVAQQASAPDSVSAPAIVPHLIRFSGQLKATGPVGITFTLHKSQHDSAALWIETQNVQPDASGKYTVLLGATKPYGIPVDLFLSGDAQWLEVRVEGQPEQPRVLLVSVPYALKAAEADTLAGHAASDFVTTEKLSSVVDQQVRQTHTAGAKPNLVNGVITDPATNFTDTTTNQVVAVTQLGTGKGLTATSPNGMAVQGVATAPTGSSFGVYGQSASTTGVGIFGSATSKTGGSVALFGSAASTAGIAIAADETATTGSTIGLETSVASPTGTAALFQNTAAGPILSAKTGTARTQVFSIAGDGSVTISKDPNNVTAAPALSVISNYGYGAQIQGGAGYAGIVAAGGVTTFTGYGANGGVFTGAITTSENYSSGSGVLGNGGANGGAFGGSPGIGVSGNGGDGGAYQRGGEGIQGWGGPGIQGGMGGYFVGGYGNSASNSTGGPGIVATGGTGNAGNGDALQTYGSGRFSLQYETPYIDALIGDPGCGGGFAAIGFGLSPFTFSNCLNYSVMGDGTSLFLNRPTGGSIVFRQNNANQMVIASGGAVTIFGNLTVGGKISAGTKDFVIDHPLDPQNKLLYHTSIESPDMKTLYDGVIKLDARGEAWVMLPDYFEALNQDFRYMLTPLDRSAPNLHVARRVAKNRFKIAGGKPNMEVSWQVTGIRHDAFANANRGSIEVEKSASERGKYLHPESFGVSAEQATSAAAEPAKTPEISGNQQ